MALIKCTECGHMISDRAIKCPKCGNPVIVEATQKAVSDTTSAVPTYYQKEIVAAAPKRSNNNLLYVIIGILVVVLIALGFFFLNLSKNGGQEQEQMEAKDAIEEFAGPSPKEQITQTLEELFNDVMEGNIGCDIYDEKFFSSDFNRIYKKVDEIDERLFQEEGNIGFWDWTFWTMAQDDVEMDITVNDVYNIKSNEAMAKVTFKFFDPDSGECYDTRIEEIKVVLENGKWVLDDVHGYKKDMQEFIEENRDY